MAEETTTTPTEQQTTTTTTTTASLDEQLSQKREQLTQAQITQTNSYSEYLKAMKAKTIVDEKETDKVAKLDKLMFEQFVTYQNALQQAQKLQVELSELESQQYLDVLLG
jgi:vacuolar-type H+-ATPase catalytic subunit A/Vma1